MPLKRWVPRSAPAATASSTCAYVAVVWPTAAWMPAVVSQRTRSRPWARSGASVTWRRWPRPSSMRRSTSASEGSRRRVGSWAPQRASASHGPSRWMPSTSPSSASSASIATPRSRSRGLIVTRLASRLVDPWAWWCSAAAAAASSRRSVNAVPPPPWQWMSTYAGSIVPPPARPARPRRRRAGARRPRSRGVTAVMRSPSTWTRTSGSTVSSIRAGPRRVRFIGVDSVARRAGVA